MSIAPPISIVVPVLNEERNLAQCLESVRLFSDVLVVDSASTDGTRAIAEAYGRPVFDFAWTGGFPKKRNWALANCPFQHDWVLFLDADERVTPAFVDELLGTLPATTLNGFLLTYDNWFMGRLLRHGDPMRKVALVRRGCGAYEQTDELGWSRLDMEVHEHIVVAGRVGRIRARLQHQDRRDLASYYARHNEYSSWEAARWRTLRGRRNGERLPARQRAKYALMSTPLLPVVYFLGSYILKGGWLDGRAGFVFGMSKMWYFWQVFFKIVERKSQESTTAQHRARPHAIPTDLQ